MPEAGLFRRYEKLHARLIPPAAAYGAVVAAASDAATAAAGSLEYVQNIWDIDPGIWFLTKDYLGNGKGGKNDVCF